MFHPPSAGYSAEKKEVGGLVLTPPKFNIAPGKMVVGRRSFPIGKVTFQGRAVKLREGVSWDLDWLFGFQS